MGITKRAQYKVFNGTDFDVINFESEADYQGIYRQAIINGNFDIWHRGNSFSLANGNELYTADRWSVYNLYTGGTLSVTNENITDLIGSNHALKCIYTSAPSGGNIPQISYSLENPDAIKFAAKPITISFKAKAFGAVDTALVTAYSSPVEKRLNNQTTGATAFLYNNATAINSSSWTTVSVTTTVHDLSAMTINGNWGISISFKKSNGTVCAIGDGIMITQVQINVGLTRLPFSPKSFEQEWIDCMRYYETGRVSAKLTSKANIWFGYPVFFKVKKRISNPSTYIVNLGNCLIPGTAAVQYLNESGFCAAAQTNVSGDQTDFVCDWTADAEL